MRTSIVNDSLDKIILTLRGQRVILDVDLAKLYGASTKRLNEQVKRNRKRFPTDFLFQLSKEETREVVAICDHLAYLKYSHVYPFAFTEHGALMAANVLKSQRAVMMSIYVIRAFIKLRENLMTDQILEKRLAVIEKTLVEHDATLRELIKRIKPLLLPPPESPRRKIGFHYA